jgi:hypothetical protein
VLRTSENTAEVGQEGRITCRLCVWPSSSAQAQWLFTVPMEDPQPEPFLGACSSELAPSQHTCFSAFSAHCTFQTWSSTFERKNCVPARCKKPGRRQKSGGARPHETPGASQACNLRGCWATGAGPQAMWRAWLVCLRKGHASYVGGNFHEKQIFPKVWYLKG